jgi:CHAT domain-containing protein/tetratricopeptide (TPR) repeat protein
LVLLLVATGVGSCGNSYRSPEVIFDHASQAFLHGELEQTQDEASRAYRHFQNSNPEWAWKFLILEAKATLYRGHFEEVLKLLDSQPLPSNRPELAIPVLTLAGVASVNLHHFSDAQRLLSDAEKRCSASAVDSCGDVLQARGVMAIEQDQPASGEKLHELSLEFARSHHDRYLESTSLLNLGDESLSEGRFDEAIDRSQAAYKVAKDIGARIPELGAQGNMGWAYYRLGDSEKALQLSTESLEAATQLGYVYERENELTNIGYIQMDEQKFDQAGQSFRKALDLAEGIKAQQDIYDALRVLARLAMQTDDLDKASEYTERALNMAQKSGNHGDELYPLLVQGQIAARRGNSTVAQQTFEAVEEDKSCPPFLKWEAEHSLARLYEDENRIDSADREYRAALATFEGARDAVNHRELRFSFLTNASRIYDDYVHFLVTRGKTDEALRWADFSRARTLAEGLGLLANGPNNGAPWLNPQEIARQAKGTILFYWLGEKQSYLWAITSRKTNLFVLPPASTIEANVERYRGVLGGPENALESAYGDGQSLYRILIAPAESLFQKGFNIFVVPDRSLNNLNFETLVVSDPKLSEPISSRPQLHYWIEDVTIANASSLRVFGAVSTNTGRNKDRRERNLLLIGNSVAPNSEYPELPKAAAQMESVARHFPAAQERILTHEHASPSAYLESTPERYSYIHFVAHGTASRLSPLDSAIVLSKDSAEDHPFKLYARDIISHPLRADLVTVSACYSVGERSYSGEGLVGLSWAFLRAGSQNVIAALWEVTDASTELLMDKFYGELDKGSSPAAALRAAKLYLLRDTRFRNPFYWAPFQLYARLAEVSSHSAHAVRAPAEQKVEALPK